MQQFCSEDVQRINQRMGMLEQEVVNIKTAFRKNDLGNPDYDGHRVDHNNTHETASTVKDYKHKFTEKLLTVIASAVGLALFTGTVSLLATKLGIGQ